MSTGRACGRPGRACGQPGAVSARRGVGPRAFDRGRHVDREGVRAVSGRPDAAPRDPARPSEPGPRSTCRPPTVRRDHPRHGDAASASRMTAMKRSRSMATLTPAFEPFPISHSRSTTVRCRVTSETVSTSARKGATVTGPRDGAKPGEVPAWHGRSIGGGPGDGRSIGGGPGAAPGRAGTAPSPARNPEHPVASRTGLTSR